MYVRAELCFKNGKSSWRPWLIVSSVCASNCLMHYVVEVIKLFVTFSTPSCYISSSVMFIPLRQCYISCWCRYTWWLESHYQANRDVHFHRTHFSTSSLDDQRIPHLPHVWWVNINSQFINIVCLLEVPVKCLVIIENWNTNNVEYDGYFMCEMCVVYNNWI